jgi:hypothetical protein
MKLLVNVNQRASIAAGIDAPHSTQVVDIQLRDIPDDIRRWFADSYDLRSGAVLGRCSDGSAVELPGIMLPVDTQKIIVALRMIIKMVEGQDAIIGIIKRAGVQCSGTIKKYNSADELPKPMSWDAANGPCTDSSWHTISSPVHLGEWLVVFEAKHQCQGATIRTRHVAPAKGNRPHGGDIPVCLCKCLAEGLSLSVQDIWDLTPAQAKLRVCSNKCLEAFHLVCKGEMSEEWILQGTKMYYFEKQPRDGSLQAAYSRGFDPLPLLRRLSLACHGRWYFTAEAPARSETVWALEVKGGWVVQDRTGAPEN